MPEESTIGAYGEWAASLAEDPGELSLRRGDHDDVDTWREAARGRASDLLARPDAGGTPEATVEATYEYDGLHVEELSWQLPYGPRTEGVFLKPADAEGELPGVMALHDHSGVKYFGKRKIAKTDRLGHPLMEEHREGSYGGRPWANALAKRGYAVLAHDGFAFASRRVRLANVLEDVRGDTPAPSDDDHAAIAAYDDWASDHESVMAKSLFSAGTTWPGVFLTEDQRALDVLCAREDVDASRVGCGGLSGGGLRTVFLGGMDERVQSAVCAGMMTTWEDYLLNKSWTHTWMCYLPLCPVDLDYSEILGLRAPKPTLVLNNREDPLFTVAGMERAEEILRSVYEAAGTGDRYRCSYYGGTHKFDGDMQTEAFEWFDETL
jgi:dienelactone hydrolase